MDDKLYDFYIFLESIHELDPNLISAISDATLQIFFDDTQTLLEAERPKSEAIKAALPYAKAGLAKLKSFGGDLSKYLKGKDDVADVVKKSADDVTSVAKKSADDVASGARKQTNKPSRLKKGARLIGKAALGGMLMADGDDDELRNSSANGANTVGKLDSSGRFWPTNFHSGSLTDEQQELIDTTALFGPNVMPEELITELNSISNLDSDEIEHAKIRYAEVYDYWSDVYRTGMRNAYDDQMDKGN